MPEQRRIVLAVTGAGDTRLAGSLLKRLVADDRPRGAIGPGA
jgi:hypothetical protein